MTGYTLGDKHLSCLREVVEASKITPPETALPWPVLGHLRTLIRCDNIQFTGIDYGAGYSYFAQWSEGEEQSYDAELDPTAKAEFFRLVKAGTPRTPWIPDKNEALVSKLTDYMSVRQWRSLPVYVDLMRQGPGAKYGLYMNVPDGLGRQLRLLFFRESGSDFNERERFDLQLLLPHLEQAYRRGVVSRVGAMLTPRQTSLLQLVREGFTNRQIARRMGLSEGTVRTHLNNIYARLGARSRTEAVTTVFGQTQRIA
jgi:DNA-binding CsgD family transcriptional regulator